MKTFILYLVTLVSICSCQKQPPTAESHREADNADLILRISQQHRLYTAEYQIRKIVTHQDLLSWKGSFLGHDIKYDVPFGERKIAIPIDITLSAYIDFSAFNADHVQRSGSSIHITLPTPRIVVTSSRVDHKGMRQYAGLVRSEYTDEEITTLTRQSVLSILEQAAQTGILETARSGAEAALIPMLSSLGYAREDIHIAFAEDVETMSAESLYDNEGSVVKVTK